VLLVRTVSQVVRVLILVVKPPERFPQPVQPLGDAGFHPPYGLLVDLDPGGCEVRFPTGLEFW
jgi:hypothetical protein